MEKFIALPEGSTAFITGCKDDSGCEHQWDGEGLISFSKIAETYTDKEYHDLYKMMDKESWETFCKEAGSVTGECTCSKCGIAYTTVNNPYYL